MRKPAPLGEEVHELIRERWSPRAFSERPVDRETVLSMLQAAQWAPSCYNEQPWAFLIAVRDEPAEIQRLAACLTPANRSWAEKAPVLMLTVAKLAFERNGRANRYAFHDVGLATAQLILQAVACGLVVHPMAGFDRAKARETYRIPEGWEPAAALAIGYPGDADSLPQELRDRELAPRQRRPLASFAFSRGWGEAMESSDSDSSGG